MGTNQVIRIKRLGKEEIENFVSNNAYIKQSFSKIKNSDGVITLNGLYSITNGMINEKILKKIIKICGSKKGKLTFDDLCYFYAIINTDKFIAKVNFLLDFIFLKEEKLSKDKYIHKVEKYFNDSLLLREILLNPSFISKNSKIERNNVLEYIEESYYEEINNYSLYINYTTVNNLTNNGKNVNNTENIIYTTNNDESRDEDEENNNKLILSNNFSKSISIGSINPLYNVSSSNCQEFESLSTEFSNIEKENNGIFPIALFENMLREININEIIIEIIGNYLRNKTHKSFFNFGLFKEILSLLIKDRKDKQEIEKGFFNLLAYPNNYIEKNTLIKLLKKYYINGLTENKLNSFTELNKHISLNIFLKLINSFKNDFTESLDHMQYFNNIFFKEELEHFSSEVNCIEILLKDHSLENYIIDRLQQDKIFYLIDVNFWKKWNDIVTSKENEDNLINERKNLRMMTKNICDKNGKLLEGKEYINDYLIISSRIYHLFKQWYGPPIGGEVKREKIFFDLKKKDNALSTNSIYSSKKIRKSKEEKFKGEDPLTKRAYELELYPVFLIFYNLNDLINAADSNLSEIKKIIKIHSSNKTSEYYPFSKRKSFSDVANFIKGKLNLIRDINSTRFLTYHSERIKLIKDIEETLEDEGISDSAVILFESKINNNWPSEKLTKENSENTITQQPIYKVGLINIGNTCYMNSILQIFLNIKKLKKIFIKEDMDEDNSFLTFLINKKDKTNGKLFREFIHILKKKWIEKYKEITPRKFKEICGELNGVFKGSYQQDAHDFYTFLVDKLHEETNIKTNLTQVKNPENVDTNEFELGNECWANTVRNNASYFFGLFYGQLKSSLICSECETKKIKYEPFSSLGLPIPEAKNIIIEIILLRLPYALRKFKNIEINKEYKNNNISKTFLGSTYCDEEGLKSSKRTKNFKIDESFNNNEKLNESLINSPTKSKNAVINDVLNLNIPLRLKLEINRTEKCSNIIDKLKCTSELNLVKNDKFVEYVMVSNKKFIKENLLVDETFLNKQTVFVYELLNYEGLRNILRDNEIEKQSNEKITKINQQEVENKVSEPTKPVSDKIINTISSLELETKNDDVYFSFSFKSDQKITDNYEILLQIKHRVIKDINEGLLPSYNYQYFFDYQDFIILPFKNSIKPLNLYKMMWKKFMYFLDSPSVYEKYVWWKKNKIEKKYKGKTIVSKFASKYIKNFLPFTLKMLNKKNNTCAYCPWFRLCSGCIIDPNSNDYVQINKDYILIVEWDREIKKKEIKNTNLNLIINHPSLNKIEEKETHEEDNKITIDDCFKLYTKKEEIKDIFCENCKKKTLFTKILEIERLPEYLVLVFKRFKYTEMYTKKIDKVINFPVEDLSLKNYLAQKSNTDKYNLFGIINHSGTLESGHYYSIFNHDKTWYKYDDSYVSENDKNLETSKVYMLIYKRTKTNKKCLRFNFTGLMNRVYNEYLKQVNFSHLFNFNFDTKGNIVSEYLNDCKYYYGEPVTVDGNKGYLINITKDNTENLYKVKVKLEKGYYREKISEDKIIKETYKIFDGKKKISEDSTTNITEIMKYKRKERENGKVDVTCQDNCKIF